MTKLDMPIGDIFGLLVTFGYMIVVCSIFAAAYIA
jgi:hypothetical protein